MLMKSRSNALTWPSRTFKYGSHMYFQFIFQCIPWNSPKIICSHPLRGWRKSTQCKSEKISFCNNIVDDTPTNLAVACGYWQYFEYKDVFIIKSPFQQNTERPPLSLPLCLTLMSSPPGIRQRCFIRCPPSTFCQIMKEL